MKLRDIEKMLDSILWRNPPLTGRAWREVSSDGFHRKCAGCGVTARAWVGTYTCSPPRRSPFTLIGYSIHRSAPLCAMCVTRVQKLEGELAISGRHPETPHAVC